MEVLAVGSLVLVMLVVPWMLARRSRGDELGGAEAGQVGVFSSDRERTMWFWAALVMAVIYTTLAPAPDWAEALRERNLLRFAGVAALFALGGVLVVLWARVEPSRREIAVGVGLAAVYVMALLRMESVEERTHLFEYGLVAILVLEALRERSANGRTVRLLPLTAFAVAATLGWIDEAIQALLPNRVYDLRDVGFNAVAAAMAISSATALRFVRARWPSGGSNR